MAASKCIKCDSMRFELKEAEPIGSLVKLNFIQCASCGAVVGVVDFYNVGAMLDRICKKIGV